MNHLKSVPEGIKYSIFFTIRIVFLMFVSITVVQADSAGMETNLKLTIIATANDIIPPSVPQQLSPRVIPEGKGSVTLSWKTATDNVGIASYRIYRNGYLLTTIDSAQTINFVDSSAVPGQSYEYSISAVDFKGNISIISNTVKIKVNFDNKLLMPSEGGISDGASWTHYNKGAHLKWKNAGGDFVDVNGTAQGSIPWAVQTISDTDSVKPVVWDVTTVVQAWINKTYLNRGFHIRRVSGSSGNIVYASKESTDMSQRPFLLVKTRNSGEFSLAPLGDTCMNVSTTSTTFGQDENILVRDNFNLLIWFDMSSLEGMDIVSAELQLTAFKQFSNTDAVDGIFITTTDIWDSSTPVGGLAERYPNDKGISNHPDVYLNYSFDSNNISDGGEYFIDTPNIRHSDNFWSCNNNAPVGRQADGSLSRPQPGLPGYSPLNAGNALCLRIKYEDGPAKTQGVGNYGVGLKQYVKDFSAKEQVNELFVRFYIFLGDTWGENIKGQNGKRPGGISGLQANTLYAAGWGGRSTDGANGWSARGAYSTQVPYGFNPLEGFTPIGNYLYHADQAGDYGDILNWDRSPNSLLNKGRWYCIEQQLVMNTRDGNNIKGVSGANDGIIRGWVDGRLVYEKTDIRFTDMNYINIDVADLGLYFGGVKNTPYDQHMAIDNVVIARSYIGPMKAQ